MKHLYLTMNTLVIAIVLSSCSGGAPRLVASYPTQDGETVPWQAPYALPGSQIYYSASMEIEVPNVDRATRQAEKLADRYGGYLSSSQSWYTHGQKRAVIDLQVPSRNFDALVEALAGLGTLKSERLLTDRVNDDPYRWSDYSQITLHLWASTHAWGEPFVRGWDPIQTYKRAFAVFASIFGFLVDIAIWLVVVAGPFVLIGWGVLQIARRWRARKGG
jgi:hypothetical protein